jgi:DNA-3-methyladenine glycosylase I
MEKLQRCFGGSDPVYSAYHDNEWGVEVRGDTAIFERISLEIFAAGLSWLIVLRKRDAFRRAFAGFNPITISQFGPADIDRLLADPGIVRNRAKIAATVHNATVLRDWQTQGGSLDQLVWAHQPISHPIPVTPADIPSSIPEAVTLTAELKRLGFKWVGPVIVYSTMEAIGVVNDHPLTCPNALSR